MIRSKLQAKRPLSNSRYIGRQGIVPGVFIHPGGDISSNDYPRIYEDELDRPDFDFMTKRSAWLLNKETDKSWIGAILWHNKALTVLEKILK